MTEFAFLYRGRDTNRSPEQMQQSLRQWTAWFQRLSELGHIRDIGFPLEDGGKVTRGGRKTITDGPFAEAKDVVCGFTLVLARDLEAAAELARGCPILDGGGSVEVRPILKMNP